MRIGTRFDKLKNDQRESLLTWLSAELSLKEIRQRAAAFNPPFKVTCQQVGYYRRSRALNPEKLTANVLSQALAMGFAVKGKT